MEIERKFLLKELPDISEYEYVDIEQGYLSIKPTIRIRKKNDKYILTYKGIGLMVREELEVHINSETYNHLMEKIDGHPITKRRYFIPLDSYTIELDIFSGHMEGLIMAEVEFPSVEEADAFTPPPWFGDDVTRDIRYQNSSMIYSNPFKIL
ncbi:CYTH domain-containing protein [Pseudobutyrivibrio sp. UC1225]|uniref:CYTH domain-containing protein n=1 Tax=Pseudobutyrivibrio sp. UC1225 TaxID=1798185 RepID=UPI0008E103D9|nr:CYTH domain-containing protein [Pseudobutyrivibrio sp. UC1225]SFO30813.1 CYTH domain-containing protein [Pseudobutyrivibrio sp. UC1225]